MKPAPGEIELNAGRETVELAVTNGGDRPVQVGSHYHFYEVNGALRFERSRSYGFRLDIVGSSRVDLQACKLEYSIVSPK